MKDQKNNLAKDSCIPCQGGIPPMPLEEAHQILQELDKGWSINKVGHLERTILVKNFSQALEVAVKLGAIADQENHHPDLLVSYGKIVVEIWTHKIQGLTRSDFVLAAKFDEVVKTSKS
jgi:4a-hydroxytetrahydrobiopterin dehydratase